MCQQLYQSHHNYIILPYLCYLHNFLLCHLKPFLPCLTLPQEHPLPHLTIPVTSLNTVLVTYFCYLLPYFCYLHYQLTLPVTFLPLSYFTCCLPYLLYYLTSFTPNTTCLTLPLLPSLNLTCYLLNLFLSYPCYLPYLVSYPTSITSIMILPYLLPS